MKKFISTALIVYGLSVNLWAEVIRVFAASSTKLAMSEVVKNFKAQNKNDDILITFNATGKAYAQFSNGFDYDVFMAADERYPARIVKDGNAISDPEIYALGSVALYSTHPELIKMGMDALKSDKVKHISIANPKLAPYGVAATEIIKNYGLEDVASAKLVLGDNIAQSVQFVDSGAAEIGLVAFSLIKSTQDNGRYMVIDSKKYTLLKQAFVLTKYAKNKPLASKFGAFLLSDTAQDSFEKYGFGKIK
ncbi:molybdate ABC transporter substrate-binding protein [Sulfurovum sp.]|uniref:molybdate ABC transporter substrate-binding protein n=1 Tax=Sulfurovum sp. TaxID=1969726 RepID=UPI002867E75C|nr:molybdate ABC transporter substrate-binding protein [Sulfurovum sp.]